MVKGKRILLKLVIVLLSVYLIDGGKSFFLISNNIQIIISHDHISDFEVPHHHLTVSFGADEKWIESLKFDFSFLDNNPVSILINTISVSQEFSDSIWQPPKFV